MMHYSNEIQAYVPSIPVVFVPYHADPVPMSLWGMRVVHFIPLRSISYGCDVPVEIVLAERCSQQQSGEKGSR